MDGKQATLENRPVRSSSSPGRRLRWACTSTIQGVPLHLRFQMLPEGLSQRGRRFKGSGANTWRLTRGDTWGPLSLPRPVCRPRPLPRRPPAPLDSWRAQELFRIDLRQVREIVVSFFSNDVQKARLYLSKRERSLCSSLTRVPASVARSDPSSRSGPSVVGCRKKSGSLRGYAPFSALRSASVRETSKAALKCTPFIRTALCVNVKSEFSRIPEAHIYKLRYVMHSSQNLDKRRVCPSKVNTTTDCSLYQDSH